MRSDPRSLTGRLPHPPEGVGLFVWLRLRMLAKAWQALVRAPLKLAVILIAWSLLVAGLYVLAHQGLSVVNQTAGLGPFLLDRLWYLFLFTLWLLLAVSQFATAYSTLIRSEETAYWMNLPLSARWILRAKWVESSCYSAWAVVLLLMPVGLAYLIVLERPLWLVGCLIGLLLPLVGIATSLSTTLVLLWLRWLGGRLAIRRELIPLALVGMCVWLFWLLGERKTTQSQEAWFVALQELLPRMRLAMSMWLPSSWMARAFGACLTQRWIEASVFAALLWTTALLSARVLDHVAALVLVAVLRRVKAGGLTPGRVPQSATAFRAPWWTRRRLVACVVKDLALLARDPVQWSQGLVFFGLLGAYFANIHRFTTMSVEPSWRIGVASLNLACTLLVFGSLAVRFLFPQMSLEGRQLWLLHVIPGGLRQLFYAKLVFYAALAWLIIEGLLALSVTRLQVPGPVQWWLAIVGLFASASLVGLALGLGTLWIDPHTRDPARLVSSSNGALALVMMLGYVGAVAWSLVVAWGGWAKRDLSGFLLASGVLLVMSGLLGYLPVRRGLRALERLEF